MKPPGAASADPGGLPVFELRRVALAYGRQGVLRNVDFQVRAGELVGVVGPNGAGKSTLLKGMLGLLPPATGHVSITGTPLGALPRHEVARRAAFVPQRYEASFAFRVREMVAMGRTPWLGRFRPEGTHDRRLVEEAMRAADVLDLADRRLPELSGGELQRVMLARAFAQDTPALVLDEPTASLDLRHALEVLDLVRARVDEGTAAVAALHDLTVAARYCDRLIALHEGGIAVQGPPAEVLTPEGIARVFGVQARILQDQDGRSIVSAVAPIGSAEPGR